MTSTVVARTEEIASTFVYAAVPWSKQFWFLNISQGRPVWDVVASLVARSLQICCRMCKWKNFEYQSIYGKDMDNSMASPFWTHKRDQQYGWLGDGKNIRPVKTYWAITKRGVTPVKIQIRPTTQWHTYGTDRMSSYFILSFKIPHAFYAALQKKSISHLSIAFDIKPNKSVENYLLHALNQRPPVSSLGYCKMTTIHHGTGEVHWWKHNTVKFIWH